MLTQWIHEVTLAAQTRCSALITRDGPMLRDLLAPEFRYTNASGKLLDRNAYIQTYALDPSVVWSSQTLSDICTTLAGNTAVLTGVTHDIARFGNHALDARFRTTQVYRRVSGCWLYLAGHTSNVG
jgi:Domain of unknown function (DUF4440)